MTQVVSSFTERTERSIVVESMVSHCIITKFDKVFNNCLFASFYLLVFHIKARLPNRNMSTGSWLIIPLTITKHELIRFISSDATRWIMGYVNDALIR